MIHIDKNKVKKYIKEKKSKLNKGKINNDLYSIYASAMFNYNDEVSEDSEYGLGNWIDHTDRWIHNRLSSNTKKYGRGTIVMVDLGATNFGSEPSYLHPSIIIAENTFFILIVPASSQKYGKGYSDIIDATSNDGFFHNTGVQSKSYRWISKSRIVSVLGKASSDLLDKIDISILKDVPTYKKEISRYKSDIKKLETEKENLQNKITLLNKHIEAISNVQLTSQKNDDSI